MSKIELDSKGLEAAQKATSLFAEEEFPHDSFSDVYDFYEDDIKPLITVAITAYLQATLPSEVKLLISKGQQFFSCNGEPLQHGIVYIKGVSNNLLNSFTNKNCDAPNANPIILDGQGCCQIDVYVSESVRVEVQDCFNNIIAVADCAPRLVMVTEEECRTKFQEWASTAPGNLWFTKPASDSHADTKDGYVDGIINVTFQGFKAGYSIRNGDACISSMEG